MLTMLFAGNAFAYEFFYVTDPWGGCCTDEDRYRWSDPVYVGGINEASWDQGTDEWNALERAVLAWDQSTIPGSPFGTTVMPIIQSTVDTNDETNGIHLLDLIDLDPQFLLLGDCTVFGVSEPRYQKNFLWFSEPLILEYEVYLNEDCAWQAPTEGAGNYYDVADERYFASEADIEQVLVHEIGHVIGLSHERGNEEFDLLTEELIGYEGWPTLMEVSLTGGGTFDAGYLARLYAVNENDRQGIRDLYVEVPNEPVDWAVQSYQVYDDQVLLAAAGEGCFGWLGSSATRPDPHVDVFAAAQDAGEAYGDCPVSWPIASRPVTAPLDPLQLYNNVVFSAAFTLLNLGTGGGDVEWQVLFTDDLTDTDCTGANCWVLYEDTLFIGAGVPHEHVLDDLQVPTDATAGEYYVMAVMDPSGAWADDNPENNTAVWNRKVESLGTAQGCIGCHVSGPNEPTLAVLVLGAAAGFRRRSRRA